LIAPADHLVLPLACGRSLNGERKPAAILRKLWAADRAAVVLTDSARGGFVRQAGDAILSHVPAHTVLAVDTTGAGHCFHGAYALARAEGKSPRASARYAAAALQWQRRARVEHPFRLIKPRFGM